MSKPKPAASSDGAVSESGPHAIQPTELLGEWRLTRRVCDDRAGLSGTVEGQLTLSAEADQIAWYEKGILLWNGSRMPVSRSYTLRRSEGEWWLYFPDGKPFHAWQPGRPVQHPCSEDVYEGLITIVAADEWQTEWNVRGPDTAQRITTRFTALPSRDPLPEACQRPSAAA